MASMMVQTVLTMRFMIICQNRNKKLVSSEALLSASSDENVRLAMFYVGSNVMDWPLEAQRALTDGHEICVRESVQFSSSLDW